VLSTCRVARLFACPPSARPVDLGRQRGRCQPLDVHRQEFPGSRPPATRPPLGPSGSIAPQPSPSKHNRSHRRLPSEQQDPFSARWIAHHRGVAASGERVAARGAAGRPSRAARSVELAGPLQNWRHRRRGGTGCTGDSVLRISPQGLPPRVISPSWKKLCRNRFHGVIFQAERSSPITLRTAG